MLSNKNEGKSDRLDCKGCWLLQFILKEWDTTLQTKTKTDPLYFYVQPFSDTFWDKSLQYQAWIYWEGKNENPFTH